MARLNSGLLITTLLVLAVYSSLISSVDSRKILKMETQEVPSLQGISLPASSEVVNNHPMYGSGIGSGNGRLVAHLGNNERVLVSSNPSPGAGHK